MGYIGVLLTTVGILGHTMGASTVCTSSAIKMQSQHLRTLQGVHEQFKERQKAITSPEAWRTYQMKHIANMLVISHVGTFKRISDKIDLTRFPRNEIAFGCEHTASKMTKVLVTPFATYLRSQ